MTPHARAAIGCSAFEGRPRAPTGRLGGRGLGAGTSGVLRLPACSAPALRWAEGAPPARHAGPCSLPRVSYWVAAPGDAGRARRGVPRCMLGAVVSAVTCRHRACRRLSRRSRPRGSAGERRPQPGGAAGLGSGTRPAASWAAGPVHRRGRT